VAGVLASAAIAGLGQSGCEGGIGMGDYSKVDGGATPTPTGSASGGGRTDSGPVDPGDPQTPPVGAANVHAWLAGGAYRSWSCQPEPHWATSPSTHGKSRTCSNAATSAHGAGEYPVGAASVIELHDNHDTVVGYGVSRHVSAGTEASTWYWYGEISGVFLGDGNGLGACASCHARAGTGGNVGHDYVFVQVE
jgi:hypothetical protein